MSLQDSLNSDLKTALKSRQAERVATLRYILAQVQNRQKQKQAQGASPSLDDQEMIDVLQKEAKKRKEAIELFRAGGREELAKKESEELEVINSYLPATLSEAEVSALIDACLGEGMTEFGAIMKEVMKRARGRTDGGSVSELVKRRLS